MNQNMAGDENVKHQDDKESDVGEVSSPASQDHHRQQNLLTEGEEEEIEKEARVEREIKIKDELGQKYGTVEHDESTRKSYDGGSSGRSSSSSSSSDDESHGIKNTQAVMDISSVVDSAKVADSLSGRSADSISNAPTKEAHDSVAEKISVLGEQVGVDMSYPYESALEENEEKKLSSVEDKVGKSMASVHAALEREEEAIVQSVHNTATILKPKECVVKESDDRLTMPYNAPGATADNGVEHKNDSAVTQVLCCF